MNVSDFVRGLIGQKRGLCRMEMIKSQHLSSACKPEKKKKLWRWHHLPGCTKKRKKEKKKNVMINVVNGSRVSELTSAPWLNNLRLHRGTNRMVLLPQWPAATFLPQHDWKEKLLVLHITTSPHSESFPSSWFQWMDGRMNEWMNGVSSSTVNEWMAIQRSPFQGDRLLHCGPPPCLMAVN